MAVGLFCICFTYMYFFNFMKDGIHELDCEALYVFTTNANGALAYNIEQLDEYNIHIVFEILDMPASLEHNKVNNEIIGTGRNYSRVALHRAKQQYYQHSMHQCVVVSFPAARFTVVDASYYVAKRRFLEILSMQMAIVSLFFALVICVILYDQYQVVMYTQVQEANMIV